LTAAGFAGSENRALTSEGKAAEVEDLIAPSLGDMGYDVVRVQLGGGHRQLLQVMAERRDGRGMTVEDCAEISRAVSVLLDVADPIRGAFTLEVSSPGIDRPLTRPEDFERFAGFEAKLELRFAHEGRRRFRGRLLGLEDAQVRLATEDGELRLPFGELAKAKLVLTDDLLAAAQGGAGQDSEAQDAELRNAGAQGGGRA
jgi:ribosome maturation factor RimP